MAIPGASFAGPAELSSAASSATRGGDLAFSGQFGGGVSLGNFKSSSTFSPMMLVYGVAALAVGVLVFGLWKGRK